MKRLYAIIGGGISIGAVVAVLATKKFVFDGHQFKDCRRCKSCIGNGAMLSLQVHLADDHRLGVDAAIAEANRIHDHWKRRNQ